jgi:hypothetical protein
MKPYYIVRKEYYTSYYQLLTRTYSTALLLLYLMSKALELCDTIKQTIGLLLCRIFAVLSIQPLFD